jgi:O-antigen ligase
MESSTMQAGSRVPLPIASRTALKVFAALNVLLYCSNAYLYFWWAGLSPIKPVHWYLVTTGLGVLLMLMRHRTLVPPRPSARVVVWAVASIILAAFSFVFVSAAGQESTQAFIVTGEPLVLLIVFILLFQDRDVLRTATYTLLLVVVAGVLINYVDFFARNIVPAPLSLVPGRAAGLYLDANVSGYSLAFGMLLSAWILPRRVRFAYCLFVGTAVLLTFSRSSIMLWALTIVAMAWCEWFLAPRRWSVALTLAMVVIVGWGLVEGAWVSVARQVGADRYLDQNTASRIGGSFIGQNDDSSEDRLRVAQRGIAAFLDAPLLGHGIGALHTRDLFTEPHNQYIVVAAEGGIVGLAMFVSLIVLLWISGSDVAQIMAAAYAFGCVFLHFILISTGVVVILALAVVHGGVLAPRGERERSRPRHSAF